MTTQIKIQSDIFEIGNQQALEDFFNFVNIHPQFVQGSFLFENSKQQDEFNKFRNSFQIIKSLFPNFELKFKKLKNDQKGLSSSVLKQETKTNDESAIVESSVQESAIKQQSLLQFDDLQKNNSQINKSIQNKKQTQNKLDNQQVFKESQYKLNESLDQKDEDDEDSLDFKQQNQQKSLQSAFPSLISEVSSQQEQSQTFEQFLESNQKKIDDTISKLNFSLSCIFPNQPEIKDDLTVIEIQGIKTKDSMKLKNPLTLPIISALFQPEWNTLIGNLNLSKQKENLYKQKLQQDVQVQKTQIQAFIDQIQLIEISFCYYTQYVMIAESKINEFLKSIEVYTFQNKDEFYLVSRKKSKEQLLEIYQQINNSYRGVFLNFSNIKPYQTDQDLNKDLQKVRFLFHKKFLSEEIKKYSFYQYFNEKYFFFEMNFSKILENRETIEKYIKKYVEAFIKDLFLIKFQISTNNEIDSQIEAILQQNINQKSLIVIYNQNEFMIFGPTAEIFEYLQLLEKNYAKKIAIKFSMIKLIIDQSNFTYQIKGDKLNLDFTAIYDQLKQYGYEYKEILNQAFFVLPQNTNCTFQNLIQSIKYLCINRGTNSNYPALAQLHQMFRKSIENKQLTVPLNFLSEFQNKILEEKSSSIIITDININPQLQGFQYKQLIELKPQFLDCIIREIYFEEFEKTFNQKNYSLTKIDEGKYQLCSTTKQILTQFETYFIQFQTEIINLDDDSLRALELSHLLKEEFKQQKIGYRVQDNKLCLVTQKKNYSLLQQATNTFKNYLGFVFYMVSLGKKNQNERPEYLSLVQARTGYMKVFFRNQILENIIYINKLEQREVQEITSLCIIHLDFARANQQNLQDEEKQQIAKQVIELLTRKYQIMYYLEIKTKEKTALRFIQYIDRELIYTTFKQQYHDNYIQILGSKTNYQEIYKAIQSIQFNEEDWKETEISIYIEQFCPFQNLIQNQESLQKFKRDLEKKGFEVDDTSSIKWIIKPKLISQTFQIFALLAVRMEDDQEFNRIFQPYQSSIIQDYQRFNSDMSMVSLVSAIRQNQSSSNQIKQDKQKISEVVDQNQRMPQDVVSPKQVEPNKAPVQQQATQNLPNPQPNPQSVKAEVKEHAKTLLPESTLLELEKKSLEIEQKSAENDNSATSINSESLLNQSVSEVQPNSQAQMFQFQTNFDKECLIVEFKSKRKEIDPPPNETLVQFLKKNYSDQEFQYFLPEVDTEYVNYFQQLTQYHTIVYIVQKIDKEYRNEFSKKLLYYLHHDKAVEKFMSHKSLILVCFKTNKNAHFWIPNKEKPYQICLKDPNQTFPYLWVRRK